MGTTQTHALRLNSPAIDKGTNFFGAATGDQRGQVRPFDFPLVSNASNGNGTDIRAFERQLNNVSNGKYRRFIYYLSLRFSSDKTIGHLYRRCEAYPIDQQKGLAAGANDYLTKPYFADITVTIRQNIDQTKKSMRETASINI